MDKNFKQSLLLLIEIADMWDGRNNVAPEEEHKHTLIYNLLVRIMEEDKDFDKYLMEVHGRDYTGIDDDMPDAFDEWLSDLDETDRYEYFISFLQS